MSRIVGLIPKKEETKDKGAKTTAPKSEKKSTEK